MEQFDQFNVKTDKKTEAINTIYCQQTSSLHIALVYADNIQMKSMLGSTQSAYSSIRDSFQKFYSTINGLIFLCLCFFSSKILLHH